MKTNNVKKTFAVECEHGIIPVMSKGPQGIKTWMLKWFVVYDSDGRVVASRGIA